MHNIPVGVLGASGHTGRELCGLITAHPGLELVFASANEQRGQRVVFGSREIVFTATDDAPLQSAKLIFSALPHGTSGDWVAKARDGGAHVVDLSQDMRPGTGPAGIPYGLTELMRSELPGAEIVANPGCYPTAILLALAPLIDAGVIPTGAVVPVAAASGVTGAGSSPKPELMFAEVAENFSAYAVGNSHRHMTEVRAVIAKLGGDFDVLFTPHLLPVARGILATLTIPVKTALPDPTGLYRTFYAGERFILIQDRAPTLRTVVRRNSIAISVTHAASVRQPTVVVIAAIDNLVKGAAGQAVQNANVVLGLDETSGLIA